MYSDKNLTSKEKIIRFLISNFNRLLDPEFFNNIFPALADELQQIVPAVLRDNMEENNVENLKNFLRRSFLKVNFIEAKDELMEFLMKNNQEYFSEIRGEVRTIEEDGSYEVIYEEINPESRLHFIAYKPFRESDLPMEQAMRGADSHMCPVVIFDAYKDECGNIHKPFLMCFDSRGENYLEQFLAENPDLADEVDIMDYKIFRQFAQSGCVEDTLDILITLILHEEEIREFQLFSDQLDTRRNPTIYFKFMIPFIERYDETRKSIDASINGTPTDINLKDGLRRLQVLEFRIIFRNGNYINMNGDTIGFVEENGEKRVIFAGEDPIKKNDVSPINFSQRQNNYMKLYYEDPIFPEPELNEPSATISMFISNQEELEKMGSDISKARNAGQNTEEVIANFLKEKSKDKSIARELLYSDSEEFIEEIEELEEEAEEENISENTNIENISSKQNHSEDFQTIGQLIHITGSLQTLNPLENYETDRNFYSLSETPTSNIETLEQTTINNEQNPQIEERLQNEQEPQGEEVLESEEESMQEEIAENGRYVQRLTKNNNRQNSLGL